MSRSRFLVPLVFLSLAAILPAEDKPQNAVSVVTGDRVRIGTSSDMVSLQGVLISATQVALPFAPVPEDKKRELRVQLQNSRSLEQSKPASPASSEGLKPEH